MSLLFTAHTKVISSYTKNIVIEKNITFTASSIEKLFFAICQDGLRFNTLYDGHYKFLQHTIIPIKSINVESIAKNIIKVHIETSTDPSYEVIIYHPSEVINNKTLFDNSSVCTVIENNQTVFNAQINKYFNEDSCFLNAKDRFIKLFSDFNY